MKFTLTFKTPGAVERAMYENPNDMFKIEEVARKFVAYYQYVQIEIDTEEETAIVRRISV